jgi:tripartite-type tricarboxylate transporter receptor subunit TctC
VVGVCFLLAATAVQAQGYPHRPLRLVVGIAAGGGIDILSCAIVTPLGDALRQAIVVDNRPGAGNHFAAWMAATALSDVPKPVVATLNKEVVNVLAAPEVARRLDARSSTPDELGAWVRSETKRWREVATAAGVKAD